MLEFYKELTKVVLGVWWVQSFRRCMYSTEILFARISVFYNNSIYVFAFLEVAGVGLSPPKSTTDSIKQYREN